MGGRTVWLVGMMGSGKSAVGRALARQLGLSFLDTDERVEARAGRSVAAIFAEGGEAAFRALERGVIEELAGRPAIVALGGGAIAQPGSREELAASGTLVWLRAAPATLLERVGDGSGRPLLESLDRAGRLARLRELLAQREAHYAAADLVVDTDGKPIERVAAEIARALEAAA
jgi:shikimate kinase